MNSPKIINTDEYTYEGGEYLYYELPIYAGKGIHENAFNYISENYSKESKILILGAGSGAFDCRLVNGGYTRITSIDINFDNYLYKNNNITFIKANLNEDFSQVLEKKYDLIVAIEVIEHLYSSDAFLKSCKKLLSPQGGIIISTPNPRSYGSRWKFFLYGYHNGFVGIPALYHHINPIHIDIFKHLCFYNDLEVKELSSFNHEYKDSKLYKKILMGLFVMPLKLFDFMARTGLKNESGSILFMELSKFD